MKGFVMLLRKCSAITVLVGGLIALSFPIFAGVITVCQCNINGGGKWTDTDQSVVTYDTARNFAQWVATINPQGSTYPPVAVVGMEELMSETDRTTIEGFLEQYTGAAWSSSRIAQGVNNSSGIGFFWRPDLVETKTEWYLGEKTIETIDNGYADKFAGRLFRKLGTNEAFGLFTGKLVWNDAILNGHAITEEERRREAVDLKNWIRNGEPNSPAMSSFPGTARVITTDLNTDTGTSTWNEMNLEFTDPSSQHTWSSFNPIMDLYGSRYDYIWWDYDAYGKYSGGFADAPKRSPHVGSDHRSVYATINLHSVDLTPPVVSIISPVSGEAVYGTTKISANTSDASGVLNVQFLVDGNSIWTDTTSPFDCNWSTSGYAPGCHTITAIATDASSNVLTGQSAPVVVWLGAPGSHANISAAKNFADGELVCIADAVVTKSFGSYFYVEELDRSSGIRVSYTTAPSAGAKVTVIGRINSLNGERYISATSLVQNGNASIPEAVGITNKSVGGGAYGGYTKAVYKGQGLNNVGMLVKCWGKVTGNVDSYYMYIDDGSGLADNSSYNLKGLRIDISGLSGYTPPAAGKYVEVTGISTTFVAGNIQRKIKVCSAGDIQVLN